MAVDQSGQNGPSVCLNERGACRNGYLSLCTDRLDPAAFDDNDGIIDGIFTGTVDERAAIQDDTLGTHVKRAEKKGDCGNTNNPRPDHMRTPHYLMVGGRPYPPTARLDRNQMTMSASRSGCFSNMNAACPASLNICN